MPVCSVFRALWELPRRKRSRSCVSGVDGMGEGWQEIWGTDGGLVEATMSESETLTPPKERNRKPNVEIYIWDFQVFRRYCRKDTFIER